ncbi:MAG: hypothetical protein PHY62_07985 [Gallionella sp.]|nr:hypothetical protein [Gallionella sp.]
MKNDALKPFTVLKKTDNLVRLDWFTGTKYNIAETDNPLVECIFTPFDLPPPGSTKPKPLRHRQFNVCFSVGYLPILSLGVCFRGGKLVRSADFFPIETIVFDLDVSEPTAITECTLADIPLDLSARFISKRYQSAANRAGLKKLSGMIRRSTNENINKKIRATKSPLPAVVLIHELEIVRFYLTNSSHSCKNIFTGAFSAANLEKRVVNELHEKRYLDPVTGKGRFVYRHGYKEKDASSLGRILFEPNDLALQAAQRVYNKATADRINDEQDWMGYPRTFFPFHGKTKLKLSGRWVKTISGEFIFLAHRIHSCSAAFPYKELSYCDEITPGGAPAPKDAEPAFSGQTTETGPANDDKTIGESKSDQRPRAPSNPLRIELHEREYAGLRGIRIYKEKLRDCTHKYKKKPHVYRETMIDGSTGEGTSGDSSAARQSITEKIITPSPVTIDLRTFMQMLELLKTLRPSWNIDRIVVDDGPNDGESTSYFPEIGCPKLKHISRQFSFTDEDKLVRRRFLCVEVCVDGRYVYLFEAQRRLRNPAPPDDPFKEDMAVLLLRSQTFEEILGDDFLPMIVQTVENKHWPNADEIGEFVRDYTNHSKDDKSIDSLCERVMQLVERHVL